MPKPFPNENEPLLPEMELSARERSCSDQLNWLWSGGENISATLFIPALLVASVYEGLRRDAGPV